MTDLDTEMAFTSCDAACRDLHPDLRECRRAAWHEGDHASGFDEHRITWPRGITAPPP